MATQSAPLPNPQESPPQVKFKTSPDVLPTNIKADPAVLHQKCVCELCTCGKHHCPRPRVKGIFQTSYQDHYKQFQFESNLNGLPRQYHYEMKHYNPENLKSHYQQNYFEKPLPQTENFQPESPPKRYVSFNDETEYKKNYHDFEQNKAVSVGASPGRFEGVAKMILPPPVKFNGTTSYNEHYKGYAYDKKQDSPELNMEFIRSPIKFEGVSSYKSNYVPPPKVETKPIQMEYQHVSVPFKGQSTYKNHFVGYKVEPAQVQASMPHFNSPPVKFEGKTAYQQYHDGKMVEQRLAQKHNGNGCICDVITIPTVNYLDKPHMRFDVSRNQWV